MTTAAPRVSPVRDEGTQAVVDFLVEGEGDAHSEVDEDVLVAIPAFNEDRFIGSVVHAVFLEGFRCVVVDDGSTDRTVEIAEAAGAFVVRHEQNRGKGTALNSAFEVARSDGAAFLVAMDGDWQHDPRDIRTLLEPLRAGTAQVVSGSRFMVAGQGRIPAVRGVGLRAMTIASNVASGAQLTDSQTGFHAYSREAINTFHFRSGGFSVESEVQFLSRRERLRHIEVPIGARYVDPPKRNVFGQGLQVLDGMIRLVAHYRPLLFFGVPGFFLLVSGLALGGLVVDGYRRLDELAVGYALLTVLLLILGSIGLIAGFLLHALRGTFLSLEHQINSMTRHLQAPLLEATPRRSPVAVGPGRRNGRNAH